MKGYTVADVAQLIKLAPAQVRAFARDGFLSPGRGPRGDFRFSFQDLVVLRAAKDLAAARIPARRIRRTLKRLRQELPRGRSLAELRIVAEGDRIVVSDGYTAWNPESGQLSLDFAVRDLATRAAPIANPFRPHRSISHPAPCSPAGFLNTLPNVRRFVGWAAFRRARSAVTSALISAGARAASPSRASATTSPGRTLEWR